MSEEREENEEGREGEDGRGAQTGRDVIEVESSEVAAKCRESSMEVKMEMKEGVGGGSAVDKCDSVADCEREEKRENRETVKKVEFMSLKVC